MATAIDEEGRNANEASLKEISEWMLTWKRGDDVPLATLKARCKGTYRASLLERIRNFGLRDEDGLLITIRKRGDALHLCTAEEQFSRGKDRDRRAGLGEKRALRDFANTPPAPLTEFRRKELSHRTEAVKRRIERRAMEERETRVVLGTPESLPRLKKGGQ